jgi:hypothetical protein
MTDTCYQCCQRTSVEKENGEGENDEDGTNDDVTNA